MLEKRKIISINVSIGKYQEFVNEIIKLAHRKESNYVCVANVHMLVEAYNNKDFQKVVNDAVITTPDGMPLVKALKLLYNIEQDRVAGMDLFPDILREAQKEKLSVFFYGSTKKVLELIVKKSTQMFPNLKIAGVISPPFRPLTSEEKENIIKQINKAEPNIVFVSLGCPKQEKWMNEMYGEINSLMIGVGAAFPVFAGIRKRAPIWMQRYYLEWFYRLLQEPKRLLWRYLYTNTKFVYLLLREILKEKGGNDV